MFHMVSNVLQGVLGGFRGVSAMLKGVARVSWVTQGISGVSGSDFKRSLADFQGVSGKFQRFSGDCKDVPRGFKGYQGRFIKFQTRSRWF